MAIDNLSVADNQQKPIPIIEPFPSEHQDEARNALSANLIRAFAEQKSWGVPADSDAILQSLLFELQNRSQEIGIPLSELIKRANKINLDE